MTKKSYKIFASKVKENAEPNYKKWIFIKDSPFKAN